MRILITKIDIGARRPTFETVNDKGLQLFCLINIYYCALTNYFSCFAYKARLIKIIVRAVSKIGPL